MRNRIQHIGCFLVFLALLPSVRAGAQSVLVSPFELGANPPLYLFESQNPLPFPLGESPREIQHVKSAVASRTWQAVLPAPVPADLDAYAVLYKGKLVTIDLSSPTVSADLVRASMVSRYGKGVRRKVEESGVPPEGCEPWGLHYWEMSDGTTLYLVNGKERTGVSLHMRDVSLYGLMARDRAVHIEPEQCIAF